LIGYLWDDGQDAAQCWTKMVDVNLTNFDAALKRFNQTEEQRSQACFTYKTISKLKLLNAYLRQSCLQCQLADLPPP
jgi:hypothetical protein